jgi:signal transduction histidine kinase
VVEADGVARFESDLEAAIYFCCVEAVQNAGKYAGEDARVTIRVGSDDCALWFAVLDDGVGFESDIVEKGQGFVNMADRLGAFGGSLRVDTAPGRGTEVTGNIPLNLVADSLTPPGT